MALPIPPHARNCSPSMLCMLTSWVATPHHAITLLLRLHTCRLDAAGSQLLHKRVSPRADLDLIANIHDTVHSGDAVIADVADVQQACLNAIHLQEGTIRLDGTHNCLEHLSNLQHET